MTGAAAPRYDSFAIALHWFIAALVVVLVALGTSMTDLPRNTPERAFFVNLHKSLGILTLGLMLVRSGWRLFHRPPTLPHGIPAWRRHTAGFVHGLLYAVLLLQPTTGYLMSAFGEYGVRFFGIPLPVPGSPDPGVREWFAGAHRFVACVLVSLIVIHVAAAFGHGLITRDGVVQRMLPRRTNPG